MQKVGFLKSIHVKIVLIYVLLILTAFQIIGLYFAQQLEETLTRNFKDSIRDRVSLVEFSVREELTRERSAEDPPIETSLRGILSSSFTDINEIQVIDSRFRIRATSDSDNQLIVGQRAPSSSLARAAISTEIQAERVYLDPNTNNRIWVLATPIVSARGEVIGAIYLEANIESVYSQISNINQILSGGIAVSLAITIVLGILIATTITRPISDMRKQAQAMAKGNFSRKVHVYGNDEIGQLAVSFNHMTNRLQESQSTMEGERRKLSSVLTNMTDGVIATDRKGRIILINDPGVRMLRTPRDLVLNRPIASVLGLDPEYTFEDLVETQDPVILDFSTRELPYILRANFSVIQKETGFVNGLITVLHDITEQEKIDMERREFVANVSHELRTPLTTMRSYLEALAEGAWKDDDLAPHFLEVTQTETERMIRLVNDLLQLSRMDAREYELNSEIVDFNKFFNRIIDRFDMSKPEHIHFQRLMPDIDMFVEVDTDKMTQVIDNIISNAMKYSPNGGNVRFGVIIKDEMLKVMVSDDGMGIPKENLDRVFDRFYRVDRARSRAMGGTGLGLAIAKEMIEAHGGEIWAESEEGKGTTIFFTLPVQLEEEGEWG